MVTHFVWAFVWVWWERNRIRRTTKSATTNATRNQTTCESPLLRMSTPTDIRERERVSESRVLKEAEEVARGAASCIAGCLARYEGEEDHNYGEDEGNSDIKKILRSQLQSHLLTS